jgi:hypothetical protein
MASGSRHSDPCFDIRVLLRAYSQGRSLTAGAFWHDIRRPLDAPCQFLREFLGEAEGDRESVRCPDPQNTKIVGTKLDLKFPERICDPHARIVVHTLDGARCDRRQCHQQRRQRLDRQDDADLAVRDVADEWHKRARARRLCCIARRMRRWPDWRQV